MSALLTLSALVASSLIATSKAAVVDFQREVRPILSRHCFQCHGPDEKARKGKFRLDVREAALKPLKSGEIPIVPGKPDSSELVRRVFSKDADEVMPPPEARRPLTDAQKDLLKRWIDAGADYRPHWSFVAPKQVAPPPVELKGWAQNPIDHFILARLEQQGLKPSLPADPYSLVRRLYLDLIGLPPTPEEVDVFVRDFSSDSPEGGEEGAKRKRERKAIEALVEKLLASPHYGERWARKWLDLARYADTNGYEKDRPRNIWPWRDWVINALNADLPFDEFTIEQIAGDMLPPDPKCRTQDPLIATGFHRNSMLNEEGGIDPLEFRFYAMVDRVAVTGMTWLGLTTQCAQCHSHKFDPISHHEYYSLMAFLDNADEPEIELPAAEITKSRAAQEEKIAKLVAGLADRWPVESLKWQSPGLVRVTTASGEVAQVAEDGTVLLAGRPPERETITIELETDSPGVSQLRLEALPDDRLPRRGPGRSPNGNFVLGEVTLTAQPRDASTPAQPVKLSRATADFSQEKFPAANLIDGDPNTGWAIANPGKEMNVKRTATLTFAQPVGFASGTKFTVTLEHPQGRQLVLGKFRLSLAHEDLSAGPVEARRREALAQAFARWLEAERARTVNWQVLPPASMKANLALLTLQPDGSVFASGDQSKSDTFALKFRVPAGASAFRLEAIPDERLPDHGPGAVYYEGPKGDFFLSEFTASADGRPLKFAGASDSYGKAGIGKGTASATNCIDGDPQSGWSINGGQGQRHVAVFNLEQPLAAAGEVEVKLLFEKHYSAPLGRFRIAVTTDRTKAVARELEDDVERLLLVPDAQLTAAQRADLTQTFLLQAPELASARAEIEKLKKAMPQPPTTLVLKERPRENPRATFIHNRGEFLQQTEQVEPGVLSALNPLPEGAARNRLTFARWLVSPENPLTARVTVNRQWHILFGRGLVRTTEDFGLMGEAPSHPELLDWLAVEFMKQGWSLKKLHKLIVTSSTYQQSSRVTPELAAQDPGNILLAHGPRVRLEAEMIRDATLRASGLLSSKIGGPSVFPPQPASVTSEGVYAAKPWEESKGGDRYRRGLYTFTKRSAPFAMFNTFDAPSGESCVARREVSNTPLQALTLLNDVTLIESSQALGKLLTARAGSVEERVAYAFRRVLTRPPTEDEVVMLARFFETQKQRFVSKELDAMKIAGPGAGDANERAAWAALGRALFNLDEAITKS